MYTFKEKLTLLVGVAIVVIAYYHVYLVAKDGPLLKAIL